MNTFTKYAILFIEFMIFLVMVNLPTWIFNVLPSLNGTGFSWMDIFFFVWFLIFCLTLIKKGD